jgi:hypothetical protein
MQAQGPDTSPGSPQVAAGSRPGGLPVPATVQPAAPGALAVGEFRTEGGAIVASHTLWQSLGATVLGRLVPNSRQASLQPQASVYVGGPNGLEVLEWWRGAAPSSAIVEIDGVPMVNLPCRPGRGGPHLQCYESGNDSAAVERARAAMRGGRTLRVVFMGGSGPQSEASFDLAGFRA